METQEGKAQVTGIDLRGVGLYLALSFGIAWLAWLGLWLAGQGCEKPNAKTPRRQDAKI
jgi:hypothetical protein